MKNPKIKNALIAAVIAVFSGVLLFSVNAAFGIDAPTVAPEDSGGISPTFTGLTVAGDVDVSGNVEFDGDVLHRGASGFLEAVDFFDPIVTTDDATVGGVLEVDGIGGGSGTVLHVNNIVSDITATTPGGIQVGDANTWVSMDKNEIQSYGTPLHLNYNSQQIVQVGSDSAGTFLNVNGAILNSDTTNEIGGTGLEMPVVIFDGLDVLSFLDVAGDLSAGQDLDVNGVITNEDPGMFVQDNVKIEDNLTVTGTARIENNLSVTGSISATGAVLGSRFGTISYDDYESTWKELSAGASSSTTIACPSGEKIISCQAQTSENNTSHSATKYVRINEIYSNGTSCYVKATNLATSTPKYFRAGAICLDTDY